MGLSLSFWRSNTGEDKILRDQDFDHVLYSGIVVFRGVVRRETGLCWKGNPICATRGWPKESVVRGVYVHGSPRIVQD